MTKLALSGVGLLDPEARRSLAETLLVDDGRIAGRLAAGEAPGEDWQRVTRPGLRIAPGFIDLHFHGELVSSAPQHFAAALARDAARMVSEGATAFLATTVCWPDPLLGAALDALSEAATSLSGGAACLGLHLEGPWISPDAAGAMTPSAIRPYDASAGAELLARAGTPLRMVTLAPEIEGADALLAALVSRDVVAALGHTRASPACLDEAVARGLSHVTHLWNAMGPLHHREPGVAGAALADDRLSCDLICDGHHVHPAIVRTSARALGERMLLITDRVTPSVDPGAESALGDATPGPDGAPYRRADGTLVGSQLGLDTAVRNVQRFAGIDALEAVAACTLRPARLLGLENERGTLRVGAHADFALLDAEGRVVETWLGGEPIWQRKV